MIYRVVVKSGADTIGEFEAFTKLTFGKRLNNYGTCVITIPVSEDKLSELVELRKNTVWIYRGDILIWSGEMAIRAGDLDNKGGGTVELHSFTWFEQLRNRFTEQELRYEGVDAGQIAWDLIFRTQNQYVQDDTGADLPVTASTSNAIGSVDWTTPDNIKVDNSASANVDFGVTERGTYYLKATNFGFALPANSDITGIVVTVKELNDKGDVSHYAKDVNVKLIKAGTIQTTNKGTSLDRAETVTTTTYGGINDNWSDIWTYSDINHSGFGVALSYLGKGSIINIYSVKITVYYKYPISMGNYDLGITEGTIEASMERDRTYNNQNIAEAIISLTGVIEGFDFEITDDRVFNVKTLIGEDKTESIILDYGSNILTCRITEDFSQPVNRAIVLGEVSDNLSLVRIEREDLVSQADIKLREDITTEWDVSETETLNEKGDAILRKLAYPLLKIDLDILPNTPNITQFSLGDLIIVRIVKGFYNIKEEYRVFEWEVQYNSDGTEKLTLVLGKFTI